MKKFLWILVLMPLLVGCAEDGQQRVSDERKVSTIPWNRPESWEGQGQLGNLGNMMR